MRKLFDMDKKEPPCDEKSIQPDDVSTRSSRP